MTTPARPSPQGVDSYLRKWETLDKYTLQEKCLTLLFQKLCPGNSDIVDILLKVSALNDFYSTNIFDTHSVAKHIQSIRVAERITAGDPALVDDIAQITIGGKPRHLYSFASKYCNHHSPEAYPIFDSYVKKMLFHFRDRDHFTLFDDDTLKTYSRFVEIIRAFQRHYSFGQYSLRQLDIYLWLAGKDAFPPKKKERPNGLVRTGDPRTARQSTQP